MARRARNFWNDNRRKQFIRTIKNYNRRIRRAIENSPEIADKLPRTYTYRELKDQIKTARDLERWTKRLEGATAKTLVINKSGNVVYNSRYRITPEQTQAVHPIQHTPRTKTATPTVESIPVSGPPGATPTSETEWFDEQLAQETIPDINKYLKEETKWAEEPQVSEKKELTIEDLAAKIDIEKGTGRFPTDREFIANQIGIENLSINNYQKLLDWTSTQAGAQRSELWRSNYLKTLEANIDIMRFAGEQEAVKMLKELYNKIANMPLTNFLIAQLAEPGYVGINTLIPSLSGGTSSIDEEEMEYQLAEYERAIEEWDKYF